MDSGCAPSGAVAPSGARQPCKRQDVLVRYRLQEEQETGRALQKFADGLAARYHRTTPVPFKRSDVWDPDNHNVRLDDYEKAQGRWRKRVYRWAHGEGMPIDFEECWVAELGQPYSLECARELARRFGFLGVRMQELQSAVADDIASVAGISSSTGTALQDLSAMIADGKLGPEDAAHAARAIQHLRDLQAAAGELICRIEVQVRDAVQGTHHG